MIKLWSRVNLVGSHAKVYGMVTGKLICGAYIVRVFPAGYFDESFGIPNRHEKVAWGSFSGSDNEVIVAPEQIREM